VVETAAMAKAGRELLAGSELNFFDSIEDARRDLGRVDLVFSSGALQYCPQPLDFLKSLLAVRAPSLFITRTALAEGQIQRVGVQHSMLSWNGPGALPNGYQDREIAYPIVCESRSRIEGMLGEAYDIRFRIREDVAAFAIGDQKMDMHGYFCTLR
jgi:putative methyltransferase (TIGR04325 family)